MYRSRYRKASSGIGRNKKKKNLKLGLFLGLPLIFLAGIIFLLRADFMQASDIKVEGTQALSQNTVKNAAQSVTMGSHFFVIPKTNILFLSKSQLASALETQFGGIEKVDIGRNFFNRQVEIYVTERKAAYLWCLPTGQAGLPAQAGNNGDGCYLMTAEGYVFDKVSDANDSEAQGKVIFTGILQGDPLRQSFATAQKMKNYFNLIASLKNGGVKVSSIHIKSDDKATASTNMGDIIFNPDSNDLTTTAENSILLINNIKSKNSTAQFQYLDARYGNKIFYKLK